MIKLLLLALVVSTLAQDDKGKIYSTHTKFASGSLNLTTLELKLFAGHAMNIIRSKCPAVDAQKISAIQKYMGKLIAKSDPIPGDSKEFRKLLDRMTTCSKEGVLPKSNVFSKGSPFPFFHPFLRMKKLFVPSVTESAADILKSSTDGKEEVPAEATTTEPTRNVISTTIFVRPQEMQEGIRSSGGFINWIHRIFSRVRNFVQTKMLPFGRRKKRDTSELLFDTPATPEEIVAPYAVYTGGKDDSKGKKSFGALIDQMCRIYCTCSEKVEINNFKLAAKQLLSHLFAEDSGLDVAAKQYIDEDFLASLDKCE